ncbi:aminoglycoside phosphotransferase family protein [Deinococcus sp. AJ005]|uniref:aminoglycoside phosphotransferase family protein n=1 Tax=Deinococcus sp. AJ005 TaxID=2652443 RepID=UPI00125CA706|nr:aminoglycoside phosphotransferase family protein [Deinococcus sp. AJ005]QFP77140.1 phosphotransferase [Deinococcus sp. AJ005]
MTFEPYLKPWNLEPDGLSIHTNSSDLLPVRRAGQAAMLKLARSDEERRGNELMVWWNGRGAAQVYEHDGAALLMERLEVTPSLTEMVRGGQDDEATRILCRAAAQLPRSQPRPELPTLRRWFQGLEKMAPNAGEIFTLTLKTAQELLDSPQDTGVLHGDIHHGNLLSTAEGGWRFIDPKGLIGERGFDYANILCNPDLDTATAPGRLARQARIISETAGLDYTRLLRWALAYAGLSAAWHLEDGDDEMAAKTLDVAQIAVTELDK